MKLTHITVYMSCNFRFGLDPIWIRSRCRLWCYRCCYWPTSWGCVFSNQYVHLMWMKGKIILSFGAVFMLSLWWVPHRLDLMFRLCLFTLLSCVFMKWIYSSFTQCLNATYSQRTLNRRLFWRLKHPISSQRDCFMKKAPSSCPMGTCGGGALPWWALLWL